MAYNLQSLIQNLEQILHPNQQKLSFNHEKREQLKSLLVKATSLKTNLEKFPPLIRKRIQNIETQIRDVAFEAEDIIESHVVDQILLNPGRESLMISPPDLQHIIFKLDSAIDKVMEIGDQTVKSSFPQVSFVPNPESTTSVVGLDEDLDQVKEKLIRPGLHAKLEVITIVGMGGIGKTALARQLYNHPHVFSHFDHCAWVTISQEYNQKVILVGLVSCLTRENVNELLRHEESELGVILHKILYNSRYLIVLDDIWTTTVWEDIRMFFPDNKTRSRIVITTRDLHVADRVNSFSPHHQMHLLNEFESWELLCGKVFGNENCPPALEPIGKRIARNCRGLPLVIQVLGGFLSKAQKEEDLWEHVACDVSSVVTDDAEHFSRILALSYDHLPQHLRPCFLHFGAFPEDHEIQASRLMRLWVAEGFLQPIGEKTMEEAAEVYLKALVDRNLLDIRKKGSNGKVKSYVIHDMLRDLCIQKASEEKFLYVMNQKVHEVSLHQMRRVNIRPFPSWFDAIKVMPTPLTRSFFYVHGNIYGLDRGAFGLRLLRILDLNEPKFRKFPQEILKLVNIRYLALAFQTGALISSLSEMWNLQTLIIQGGYNESFLIDVGIFGLPQVRHVKLKHNSYFRITGHRKDTVFKNLQTLSIISASEFSDACSTERFPNIRKLGINCDTFEVVDLSGFCKLEALKCSCINPLHSANFLSSLTFSPSIKKLTLDFVKIPYGFMNTVCSLSNLEVLKLRVCSFQGQDRNAVREWEPIEGEFVSLRFLQLGELDIVHWQADETNFPVLEKLEIIYCPTLEEIPPQIGEILTLEMIELYNCALAAPSAIRIQKEQYELGKTELQVRVHEASY